MRLFLIAALALLAAPLSAQEFRMAPADYTLIPDQPLAAELRVGQASADDTFPYLPFWITRFNVITADAVRPVPGRIGDCLAVNVTGPPEGLLVLTYVSIPLSVTCAEAEVCARLLRREGLEFAADRNAERGIDPIEMTERYTRHARKPSGRPRWGGAGPSIGPEDRTRRTGQSLR